MCVNRKEKIKYSALMATVGIGSKSPSDKIPHEKIPRRQNPPRQNPTCQNPPCSPQY